MDDRRTLAEARHRTYALCGRLVLEGLGPETREVVGALPALDGAVASEDPEAWAVAHQGTWGFAIAPYESVFLSPDGLLGGPRSAAVAQAYQASGVSVGRTDTEPDHLGLELAHLAFLCAAERDAVADGLGGPADRLRALQKAFLGDHLLRWLPAVLGAVHAVGTDFDRVLGSLIADLVADHAADLGVERPADLREPAGDGLDAALDDPRTGVKHLCRLLARPSVSGWWLSTGRIGAIAQQADVPGGFGSRERKLESVVFAAVDHGVLPALVAALQAEVEAWERHYQALEDRGLPVAGWRERLAETGRGLAKLEQAAVDRLG